VQRRILAPLGGIPEQFQPFQIHKKPRSYE
jgi:hypothetical protein